MNGVRMIEKSMTSDTLPVFNRQSLFTPHRLALITMWFITSMSIIYFLVHGVRATDEYQGVRHLLHATYVLVLLWFLSSSGLLRSQLPDIEPFMFPRWKYGKHIPVFCILILLFLNAFTDQVVAILPILLIIASIWILIAWRKEIRLRIVVLGLLVSIVALFSGLPFIENGFVGKNVFIIFLIISPFMFVAGWLIFKRTNLGGIQLAGGNYWKALKSFALGCLLFVPLGLINAAEGSPGSNINWVKEFWMPFSLPWFSGIVEETLDRLLLVGLCYLLLRPAFKRYPIIAVVIAVLFSATTFGLRHGWTMERFLTTGLLYGLPMAVVFIKRDWEHAVGAHYMINFIPWIMVFLAT